MNTLFQNTIELQINAHLNQIKVSSLDDACKTFILAMKYEFEDEKINWGRILTMLIFCGCLAKNLQKSYRRTLSSADLNSLTHWMTNYMMRNQAKWLLQNGGWVRFLPPFIYSTTAVLFLSSVKTCLCSKQVQVFCRLEFS